MSQVESCVGMCFFTWCFLITLILQTNEKSVHFPVDI